MAGSLGVLIISAFTADAAAVGAGTIIGSLTVAEVVGATALVAANFALSSALAPGSSLSPQKQEANLKQTVAPRRRYYGVNKVGGTYVFWRTATGKFYLYLDLVDDTITAFDEFWLDGNQCTLDVDGFVTLPATYTFSNVKRVQIFTQLGTTDQASLAVMQAAFPGIWTADHRLRGVATALIVAQTVPAANFNAVYPQGIPQFQAVARCARVFDPRDEAQSYADPTTWAYSDNYALCLLDFLLHLDGMNLPYALIEPALDDWAARADDCDVQVALAAGGTEARFRLWGGYELDEARKTVLQRILDASGGEVVQRNDGAPVLRLPEWIDPAAMVTLGDKHISTFSTLRPGPDMGERYNEIRANVVLRETGFQEDEAQPWQNQALIAAEGLQSKLLDLTMCPSHRQARVRMKLEEYRSNPKWLGTAITNAYGMNALGEQLIRLQKTSYGFDEVVEPTDFPVDPGSYSCGITFRSMPHAAFLWNPAAEEGVAPSIAPPAASDVIDPPDNLQAVVELSDFGGGIIAAQAVLTADVPDRADLIFYAEWRTHDPAVTDEDAFWTPLAVPDGGVRGVTGPLPVDSYDFRAEFTAPSGLQSDYTYLRDVSVDNDGNYLTTADKTILTTASGEFLGF